RTELLRSLGFEQDQLKQQSGVIFAVHSVNIQYKKPARFNDSLNVITTITALRKASILFRQAIFHHDARAATDNTGAKPLCVADIKIACLHAESFSAQMIPAEILEKIKTEYVCGS
ncbi:MAG TPA: hypothetical protein ENJ64_02450, partial [Thiotrichales bacterium]|nr:hypothetical protein [Thiotrichales bacterium]